jgi:CBS domain-containing protein
MLIKEYYHRDLFTIPPTFTIAEVIKMMFERKCNGFVVVENEKPIGIISMQDIAAAVVPEESVENPNIAKAMYKDGFFDERVAEIKDHLVTTIMRKEFEVVDIADNTLSILADFLQNDLYIVPIVSEDKLVGIVTRSDVKKAFAKAIGLEIK